LLYIPRQYDETISFFLTQIYFSFECDSDAVVVEEPVVDYNSLLLYEESVYHTYEPDRLFYQDYLANYTAL